MSPTDANAVLRKKTFWTPTEASALIDLAAALEAAYLAGTLCARGDAEAGRVGCHCAACAARLDLNAARRALVAAVTGKDK